MNLRKKHDFKFATLHNKCVYHEFQYNSRKLIEIELNWKYK